MEAPQPGPDVLSYRAPATDASPPSPLLASVLAVPGLFCWISLALFIFGTPSILRPAENLVLIAWGLAIIAAIVSLVLYGRLRRKPWFVWICLAVNFTGLLFTCGILLLLIALT